MAFADDTTDILSYILIALTLIRIPLFCLAFKDKRILKTFFYYETVIEMIGHFIP